MNAFNRWTRSATVLAGTASAITLAVAALPTTAGAADITNPAQHPYPITVKIDGQVYHDGEDTLPGYDDYACTPIPDVQYDFADNEILYYDDQGDLLATAPWSEWTRISSYQTWLAQQQRASSSSNSSSGSGSGSSSAGSGSSSSSSGSGSSGSGSSGSGSSGSGSGSSSAGAGSSSSGSSSGSSSSGSGSSAPASSGSGSSGSTPVSSGSSSASSGSGSSTAARVAVASVSGAVAKAPTGKKGGKYQVHVLAGSGKATATGVVTIKLRHGKSSDAIAQQLSHGVATFSVPKLAAGTWNVEITWPGDVHYLGHVAVGAAIKVGK